MPPNVKSDHPKQRLIFIVAQDMNEGLRENVRDFVFRLSSLRSWVNGPPQFVNCREEPSASSSGDLAIETVGGYLEIYSALPPWTLPREIDRQHLDEVMALVGAVSVFSREHNLAIEFELDGVYVGIIEKGEMDRCLAEGLLGEWRRHLGVEI